MGTPNSATMDAQEMAQRADGKRPARKKDLRELREFKFVVQPVVIAVVEGKMVGEETGEPVVLYGLDQLQAFVDRFPGDLARLNDALKNGQSD